MEFLLLVARKIYKEGHTWGKKEFIELADRSKAVNWMAAEHLSWAVIACCIHLSIEIHLSGGPEDIFDDQVWSSSQSYRHTVNLLTKFLGIQLMPCYVMLSGLKTRKAWWFCHFEEREKITLRSFEDTDRNGLLTQLLPSTQEISFISIGRQFRKEKIIPIILSVSKHAVALSSFHGEWNILLTQPTCIYCQEVWREGA